MSTSQSELSIKLGLKLNQKNFVSSLIISLLIVCAFVESNPAKAEPTTTTFTRTPNPYTETPIESLERLAQCFLIPSGSSISYECLLPDVLGPITDLEREAPYSQKKVIYAKTMLEYYGFGTTKDEWRVAAQYIHPSIRNEALYLLASNPEPRDAELFRKGLSDDRSLNEPADDYPNYYARIVSAYGLSLLGDQSGIPILESVSQFDPKTKYVAAEAAGFLAKLGNPVAFSTIVKAFESDSGSDRRYGIENLMFFVPLQGQVDASGEIVEVWSLYRQALQDEELRQIAQSQLEELGTPEALKLLQEFE
ncbi:MAG: hypothetical protein WA865_07900 [Spirulinaceae cyanobacterium]